VFDAAKGPTGALLVFDEGESDEIVDVLPEDSAGNGVASALVRMSGLPRRWKKATAPQEG
jgi:hypothetical protein